MAGYPKFLFETSFDPERERAAREAERAAAAAAAEAEPPPPTFSEAELETARAEGLAAGRETGRQEALQSCEQRAGELLATLAQRLEGLVAERLAAQAEAEQSATAMALAIVRKLFPRLVESQTMPEIEAIITGCLERLRGEPRIVIRVNDDMLDLLSERITTLTERDGFEGKVVLLSDGSLADDSIRVEWADGGAERESAKTWSEIDKIIGRSFGEEVPARAMQLAAQREFEKDEAIRGGGTNPASAPTPGPGPAPGPTASPDSISSAGGKPATQKVAQTA